MKRDLEHIEIPGEHEARVRTWEVVRAAFGERERGSRRTRLVRPALVLAALAAVAAAAFSPPGQAVIDRVREAIGVEEAAEALFSLPARGQLLVESAEGPWIVEPDGSKRLLGDYREASWSPFGRFVVATRANELVALEPDGDVRWSLARPDVRSPRWGGTRTDTRIAYLSGSELRLVAGDGKGDRQLDSDVSRVAPAWRPGRGHVLTYAQPGLVWTIDAETRRPQWRRRGPSVPLAVAWSADGERLVALGRRSLRVLDGEGRPVGSLEYSTPAVALAFAPRGHTFALVRAGRVSLVDADDPRERALFIGASFSQATWSPDGSRLLLAWPEADQWLFERPGQPSRPVAVGNVGAQFGGSFPRVAGWCCPP